MRTVVAIVIFALPGLASACDVTIEGKWRSEKAETMRFNREHARLQPKTDAFLDALMGNMTLEFGNGELQLRMPDLNIPVNGAPVAFAGFEERKPYTLLLCNDLGVVISSPETGSDKFPRQPTTLLGQISFGSTLAPLTRRCQTCIFASTSGVCAEG